MVGGWWLAAVGGGWRLAVHGWWQLAVGGGWWRLAIGGWWSLGAVLKGCRQQKKKNWGFEGQPCVLNGGLHYPECKPLIRGCQTRTQTMGHSSVVPSDLVPEAQGGMASLHNDHSVALAPRTTLQIRGFQSMHILGCGRAHR